MLDVKQIRISFEMGLIMSAQKIYIFKKYIYSTHPITPLWRYSIQIYLFIYFSNLQVLLLLVLQ